MSVVKLEDVVRGLEQKLKLMEASIPTKTATVMPNMAEVMSVALKLPMFYEDRPEMWFYFAESQFSLRKIVDDQTQFDHIWQSLTTAQGVRCESLMISLPKTGKVIALKEKLLTVFGTQYKKDNELLNHCPLGDCTVLEFVGKMESLNKDPATFMKAFLLNKLPSDVRGMLSNTEFSSLTELAIAADKVIKAQQVKKTVNVIETEGEVDAVGRGPKNAKPQAKTGKTRLNPGQKGTCFYHEKHGPNAFKCKGGGCVWADTPLAAKPAGNGRHSHTSQQILSFRSQQRPPIYGRHWSDRLGLPRHSGRQEASSE